MIKINNLIKIITVKNKTLTQNKYFTNNNVLVSLINYNISNGEIIYINVNEKFRSNGIGKKMLYDCINDMKQNNINNIYCFTYKNHPFWSNIIYPNKFNFYWIDNPKYYNASTYDLYENYGKYETIIY